MIKQGAVPGVTKGGSLFSYWILFLISKPLYENVSMEEILPGICERVSEDNQILEILHKYKPADEALSIVRANGGILYCYSQCRDSDEIEMGSACDLREQPRLGYLTDDLLNQSRALLDFIDSQRLAQFKHGTHTIIDCWYEDIDGNIVPENDNKSWPDAAYKRYVIAPGHAIVDDKRLP